MKTQNLPKQSAPVIRHASSATMSGENGVEASAWYHDVWDAIKTHGPAIGKAALGAIL
jgi:hypothetical protein